MKKGRQTLKFGAEKDIGHGYIALTPLDIEESDRDPFAYAGPWCLKEKKECNKPVIIDKKSEDVLIELTKKAENTFEEVMPVVASAMNNIHCVNKSAKYWNILVGYALRMQIGFLIDRYYIVKKIEELYPQSNLVLLKQKNYNVISEAREFKKRAMFSDRFNLQLFSQVAKFTTLGCDRTELGLNAQRASLSKHVKRIKRTIHNCYLAKPRGHDSTIVVCDNGLGLNLCKQINDKYQNIISHFEHNLQTNIVNVDQSKRSIFRRDNNLSGIGRAFFRSLEWNMPMSYIERYDSYKKFINNSIDNVPLAVLQGNPKGDAGTRIWIAECVARGSRLITVQHGANYGEVEHLTNEKTEKEMSNTYMTWGWCFDEKDYPMPSEKLSTLKKVDVTAPSLGGRESNTGQIIWLSRDLRFFQDNGYPLMVDSQLNYGSPLEHINAVLSFHGGLSTDIRRRTTLRLKPKDFHDLRRFKSSLRAKLSSELDGISLDDGKRFLVEKIAEAELVIIDHFPSTAFLECLVLDIPVIAFNTIPFNLLREETRPYVEALRDQGVVHEGVTTAAQLVNKICGRNGLEVTEWWNEEERVRAISTYRSLFARASDTLVEEWIQFFDEIVRAEL